MGTRIPTQLTRFIGREREIGDIIRLLATARLLTLTGPGGCGKTRLAAAVATQLKDGYEDGVAWVNLASISDNTLVSQVAARSLNVKEQPGQSVEETLVDHLGGRQILLILDNCEHLIGTCARLVGTLLSDCPDLRILTTSRESLALAGETVFLVPALSMPSPMELSEIDLPAMGSDVGLESLSRYEAIALFLDRAAAIVPRFVLTPENARAIADICTTLDGMPLAIELAATKVTVLTAAQIAERLDNRFVLLRSDRRSVADQRHQTLRATIDWSYRLLTPQEQRLLQRLSVFAGGCTLAAAEAVCCAADEEKTRLLPLLSTLVTKSLIMSETVQRSEARFALLETIRQYAQDELEKAGKGLVVRHRHLRYFAQLAQETEPKIRGEYQKLWLNWLETENDNLRAALSWSLDSAQIEVGLRMACALFQFWTIRDYVQEGLVWLQRLLQRSEAGVPPLLRSNALARASTLAGRRGLVELEKEYSDEAANLAEAAGDAGRRALAWARGTQAWVAHKMGDDEKALALGMDAIRLGRELDDRYNLGLSLSLISFVAMSLDRYDQAQSMLDEALPLLRQSGDTYRLAMGLNYYGDLARCRGQHAQSLAYYEECLALLRDIDAVRDQASVYHNLGHSLLHLGRDERARSLFEMSLATHQAQGNELGIVECLIGFAALAIRGNRPEAGLRLLASVATLGGDRVISEWAATRSEYQFYVARARSDLSLSAIQAAQDAGKGMSVELAVSAAQDLLRELDGAREFKHRLEQLTSREREVAVLIAQGKSNDQIALELVVSKRTAEKHIAHIRSKLGFTARTQIVR